MQSFFRLPWCSEHIAPKLGDKAALDRMPPVDIALLTNKYNKRKHGETTPPFVKRQRSDGGASLLPPSAAWVAPAQLVDKHAPSSPASQTPAHMHISVQDHAPGLTASQPPSLSLSQDAVTTTSPSTTITPHNLATEDLGLATAQETLPAARVHSPMPDSAVAMTRLQGAIENEFNMQILLKHNELRLIEQELAKCQVALEQLRRCELRPSPGDCQFSNSLSSGVGPACMPSPGYSQPMHPTPYGVADGPYTRHYQSWLGQDPMFDSMSEQALAAHASHTHSGRSTRNGAHVRQSSAKFIGSTRSSDSLQSLPSYPSAPPRDKSAPLVLKRSTDGQFVKLICSNCHRGNFSSIQGFLNHCRIAHKVDLKSHDEAAIKCGHLLDENEKANIPAETASTPLPKPVVTRTCPSSVASTPHRNLIHPLNTSAGANTAPPQSRAPIKQGRKPIPTLNLTTLHNDSPLTPAADMPRLSAHFAKHRLGGDLAKAAAEAREMVELTLDDEVSPCGTPEQASPLEAAGASRLIHGNSRLGPTPTQSSAEHHPTAGRKGFRLVAGQRPRPPPLVASTTHSTPQNTSLFLESPLDSSSPHLSPHGADSNPGLVSDHDEDEDDQGSSSEAEPSPVPHSASGLHSSTTTLPVGPHSHHRTCSGPNPDEMELEHVEHGHDLDRSGVLIRRNSIAETDHRVGAARNAARDYAGK